MSKILDTIDTMIFLKILHIVSEIRIKYKILNTLISYFIYILIS